jgi:hypothetical protein
LHRETAFSRFRMGPGEGFPGGNGNGRAAVSLTRFQTKAMVCPTVSTRASRWVIRSRRLPPAIWAAAQLDSANKAWNSSKSSAPSQYCSWPSIIGSIGVNGVANIRTISLTLRHRTALLRPTADISRAFGGGTTAVTTSTPCPTRAGKAKCCHSAHTSDPVNSGKPPRRPQPGLPTIACLRFSTSPPPSGSRHPHPRFSPNRFPPNRVMGYVACTWFFRIIQPISSL